MKTRSNRGSVLILSLWILTFLGLMASATAYRAVLNMKISRTRLTHVQSTYLARGGIFNAIFRLTQENIEQFQCLNQSWATSESLFKEQSLGSGKFSIQHEKKDIENATIIHYGMKDEERKININTVTKDILLKLPQSNEEIVDAIIDWRDKDSKRESNGAESLYYEDLDPPYSAKNSPIERIEELLFVKGITHEILESWKPYITTFGDGKVNINTASRTVLSFLDIDETFIDQILEYRAGPDSLEGTEDDLFFSDEGSIAKNLFEYEPLRPHETNLLINLVSQKLLGVQSKYFRIEAVGMPHQITHKQFRIVAIVEHENGSNDFKILSWHELTR